MISGIIVFFVIVMSNEVDKAVIARLRLLNQDYLLFLIRSNVMRFGSDRLMREKSAFYCGDFEEKRWIIFISPSHKSSQHISQNVISLP